MVSTEDRPTADCRLPTAASTAIEAIGPGVYGVACSGGADSIALADAVIACAGATNVAVVTIDHGLVDGSAGRAEQVAAWARGQGAAAVVRRVVVEERASVEAAAREARYAAFAQVADELGLAAILLAHTARDQAETVLMRILRGTGPAGLAGIPARRGLFVRPFLELPRDAIDTYVREHGLPTWHDPMNDDPRITRVRIRHQILPALRAENPALDDALLRLASSAREWTEAIDAIARPFGQVPIDCPALAAQPAAIRKRALSLAFGELSSTHLALLDELVRAPSRGEVSLDLPKLQVTRTYDKLAPSAVGSRQSAAGGPPAGFYLRPWEPGDRMKPLRLKGRSRKLSDLYIDAKVPRSQRRGAHVLIRRDDQVIVWAEFVGPACEWF